MNLCGDPFMRAERTRNTFLTQLKDEPGSLPVDGLCQPNESSACSCIRLYAVIGRSLRLGYVNVVIAHTIVRLKLSLCVNLS